MKFKVVFFIWILFITSTALPQNKKQFSMNGWQFHEYDIPKLEEAIKKAPEYGVNFFIFSHRLFRSVEGFLVSNENLDTKNKFPHLAKLYKASDNHTKPHPNWQKDLLYVASLAEEVGIPYYLWIHEFDDIPDKFKKNEKVQFDNPELFSYIKERYERLLKIIPNTEGFVLTFHESNNKIFRNTEVESKLDIPERIYQLTKLIYDVAKAHNKKMILRSFLYEPEEMEYFKTALAQLPDDLIVMSKTTFHEFDPFYPPDSMHGDVGKKRQIIEIDLGIEKAWSTLGAYAQIEYIQRYVRRAREKGLEGMVGRCRLHWEKSFENSHEINLYAFSKFMENPDLSIDEVAEEWAGKRYPMEAVPYIVSAYKRTQFINHHGRYHLEFWLTKSIGTEWDDYRYYFGHIMLRSRYKWSKDEKDKELETKLYYPDIDTYYKLVEEKDEVIRQIKESIADIEYAKKYLRVEQIKILEEEFDFLLDAGKLSREWTRAFFAQRLFMREPIEKYKILVNDALNELEFLDKSSGEKYGFNKDTGHRYNIDKFILEMRWRMANRKRAIEEDELILDKTKEKLNVKIN